MLELEHRAKNEKVAINGNLSFSPRHKKIQTPLKKSQNQILEKGALYKSHEPGNLILSLVTTLLHITSLSAQHNTFYCFFNLDFPYSSFCRRHHTTTTTTTTYARPFSPSHRLPGAALPPPQRRSTTTSRHRVPLRRSTSLPSTSILQPQPSPLVRLTLLLPRVLRHHDLPRRRLRRNPHRHLARPSPLTPSLHRPHSLRLQPLHHRPIPVRHVAPRVPRP